MDKSQICYLISVTYTTDAIGQKIPAETRKKVFCNVTSVSASEFFDAGRNGLNAEKRITLFSGDYSGEQTVEFSGKRYGVYRTYEGRNDNTELYLERKTGA